VEWREWRDTHVSTLAKELVRIDNDIKARDKRQRAVKDMPGNGAQERNVPAQKLPKATINASPGLGSSDSTTTQQIKKHITSERNFATNTDQKLPVLPPSDSASTSSTLAVGAANTIARLPSETGAAQHSPQPQPAHAPTRPAKVGLVRQQESLAAQQFSNQGPQSPSSTRRRSAPSPPSRNNDRKRAAVLFDPEIVKSLGEEIFGIIRSEIDKVNLHHNELRAEIVNINSREQRLHQELRTEIENIKLHQQRLEGSVVESRKRLRSVLDENNTAKAYHDYQLTVLGRDLQNSLDRIHAVEARIGSRHLPINTAVPMAPPHLTNTLPQQYRRPPHPYYKS